VLVNFWATWCPACNSELPALEAAYRKHHPEGLELLGVAAKDTEAAVKDTVKQKGLTYPVGLNEAAARAYAVTAIPTSVFVRRDGRIASVTVGGLTREQIESKLKGIM
jgi:thiol-disulfide isomerase/thioredoxin